MINLTSGGTKAGAVTDGTKVVCRPAPANHARSDAPPTGGDHTTPLPPTTTTTSTPPPPPPPPSTGTLCGPAALVPGAVVHEAGLAAGPNGPVFTGIVIYTAT